METVVQWIEEASRELRHEFHRLSDSEANEVVSRAKQAFVVGDPRVWWLSLAGARSFESSVGRRFVDVLPKDAERVWYVPQPEGPQESDDMPVYLLAPEEVDLIRDNCPLFEYYVIGLGFDWLVCETDHDQFITVVVNPG